MVLQQNENYKLEKEFLSLKENLKKYERDNKFLNDKLLRIKETHDKQLGDQKTDINKYKNRLNILQVEKKSYEEKYSKMAENYQKFFSKINQNNPNVNFHKPANIDISNVIRKNDLIKILSKVNGTEKLIETIKNGYNESLRELLFEISALKNFVLEINNEIIEYAAKLDLKNLIVLEHNFMNMPFLDSIAKIKYALKTNIKKSFDFWNLEEPKNSNDNNESDFENNFNSTNKIFEKNNIGNSLLNKNEKLLDKKKSESISVIRGKNDSLFETEKSEKNKDDINYSISKNNQEIYLFDQTNYDHLIDFDLDNFDLDISNSNSDKYNKKIHSSIKYKPVDVYFKNIDLKENPVEKAIGKTKFKINDKVRISY